MVLITLVVKGRGVKTNKTVFLKLYFMLFSICLITSCAILLTSEITIIGKVELSDNPQTGHGGVNITTERISTISTNDGSFKLKFSILTNKGVRLKFQKIGYKDTTIYVNFQLSLGQDTTIDIGKIKLHRLIANSLDNFNDGNAYGWGKDARAEYRVENGEYSIEFPDDVYQHWTKHIFYPSGDFLLEVKAKYISRRTNGIYGIGVFDTTDTRTCLFICKDGWYKLSYFRGSWYTLKDWTFSGVIVILAFPEDKPDAIEFVRKNNISFINLVRDRETATKYGVVDIAHAFVFIGENKKILTLKKDFLSLEITNLITNTDTALHQCSPSVKPEKVQITMSKELVAVQSPLEMSIFIKMHMDMKNIFA